VNFKRGRKPLFSSSPFLSERKGVRGMDSPELNPSRSPFIKGRSFTSFYVSPFVKGGLRGIS